ncbi:MAG: hypothetical protein WCH44_00865 [Betaproteobacteria bacterium]
MFASLWAEAPEGEKGLAVVAFLNEAGEMSLAGGFDGFSANVRTQALKLEHFA